MSNDLDKKRKYFKDSVYLKYENRKSNDINDKYEEVDKKFKRKNSKINIISKVAVALIVCTLGVGSYAGIVGNINLEKIGFLRLSENYEESLVLIDKTLENDYCKITLESMAGDNSYLVAEYKISLKEKALDELGEVSYDKAIGYGVFLNNDVYIDGQHKDNVMYSIDKLSDTEYSYVQVINVMDIESKNSKLEIDFNSISLGDIFNSAEIGKKIKADINLNTDSKSEKIMIEENLDNNTKIIVEEIANTKFETFIKVKKITENISLKEYNSNILEYNSFIITDENDKQIPCAVYSGDWYGKKYYRKESNNFKEIEDINLKENDIIKVEENFTVLIGLEDSSKIKIVPTKSRIYNDRTDEEEKMFNIATWYPVKEGEEKYTAQSGLGGMFEIERIAIDDDNIIFYYNEEGTLGDEWRVIIRDNNGEMNYVHPIMEERKNINSKENKITFSRNTSYAAGLNLEIIDMKNIDNLEFTLLFGCITEKTGAPIELNIPTKNEETAKITNVCIEE